MIKEQKIIYTYPLAINRISLTLSPSKASRQSRSCTLLPCRRLSPSADCWAMPPKTAWRRLNLFALDAFVECKNTTFSFNLLVFYPVILKRNSSRLLTFPFQNLFLVCWTTSRPVERHRPCTSFRRHSLQFLQVTFHFDLVWPVKNKNVYPNRFFVCVYFVK